MSNLKISWSLIEGHVHQDDRGELRYNNKLSLKTVKRFYQITCKETNTIRAWQGHQFESKFFTVLNGRFEINLIKIDDWQKPSIELKIDKLTLDCTKHQTLVVPGGFVTGIKNLEPNAKLLVFSDTTLEKSLEDDFRFDKNYWNPW